MNITNLNKDEIEKLKNLVDEGCRVFEDINSLKEGLKETVLAVSEELDIEPKLVNKAIRTVYKDNFAEQKTEVDDLDALLDILKRK